MSQLAVMKMKDDKPSVASANNSQVEGEHGEPVDSRFREFCKNGLSLDEKSCTQAMKLFGEIKDLLLTSISSIGIGMSEEAEGYWFSFILYSVKRLTEKNADSVKEETDYNGLTLCQILRVAKLKFFKRTSSVSCEDWSNFKYSIWHRLGKQA